MQSGSSRRVVFGFTGWNVSAAAPFASSFFLKEAAAQEPTQPKDCGRFLITPRELSIGAGNELRIDPILEVQQLRVLSSRTRGIAMHGSPGVELATGSQVEVLAICTPPAASGAWPTNGTVALRTLASSNFTAFTEIGFDFSSTNGTGFYVDHSMCCEGEGGNIRQRANMQPLGERLEMSVFVDGGLLEAFLNGRVITALVDPRIEAGGLPDDRVSAVVVSALGVTCTVESFRTQYKNVSEDRPLKADDGEAEQCQPHAVRPWWPIFHIVGNVTRGRERGCTSTMQTQSSSTKNTST